jgi:hypothetical protein
MKLPKQLIPDSQKTPEWGKKTIKGILGYYNSYDRYSAIRKKDYDNYLLVDGKFNTKEFEYVTKSYGLTTPARLVNYPLILPKINLVIGELMSQGLQFSANVINRDGVRRKNEAKIAAAAELLMRPIRRQMEKVLGTELEDEELAQSVPDDIKTFSETPFRDHMEQYVVVGLKDLIQRHGLKHVFERGMADMCITYKEFYHVHIRNGMPYAERIDPRVMIWDYDMNEEDIEKGKFAGTDKYYTLNEVIDMFPDLDPKEVEKLEEIEGQIKQGQMDSSYANGKWYISEGGNGLKIRVVKMQWRSLKKIRVKLSDNPYDPETPYFKLLKEDYKAKKKDRIEERVIDDIWEGVLIGHDTVHKVKRSPNQVRYEENYAKATLDYVGIRPNTFSGSATSLVDALKNIQMLYNITMYSIALAQARAGGKAVIYDTAQKPKNMTTSQIMHHAKNSGMIFINSKQEGNQLNTFNQFGQVDFTMSNTVSQLRELQYMLEELADKVTGISAARAGIQTSGELVGVNERSVAQSSLITLPLFENHYKVVGKVLNKLAGKMKFCYPQNKWIANLFGDNQMEIVKMDKSIGLDEYSIYLQNSGKDTQDKREMLGLLGQALAANDGTVDLGMMAEALRADSATEVENILKSGIRSAKEVLQANEEQQMQIQQQANEVAQQKLNNEIQVAQIKAEADIQVAQINADAKLQDTERKLEHDADKITTETESKLDQQMLADANKQKMEQTEESMENV